MQDNNPWKHVDPGDVSKNPYYKKLETTNNTKPPETKKANTKILSGNYEISDRFDRYELGVESIRSTLITNTNAQPIFVKPDHSKIYRPLTTLESLEVMIKDFNTLHDSNGDVRSEEDRLRLFSNYKYTCTGVAYKADGKEIKILPESTELILIDKNLNKPFLSIDYAKISGTRLDKKQAKYNQGLSKAEVLNHPAWLASVENTTHGKNILKEYTEIVFNYLKTKKNSTQGMGYYIVTDPKVDQLRALYVYGIDYNSNAVGNNFLGNFARFLLAAPRAKI